MSLSCFGFRLRLVFRCVRKYFFCFHPLKEVLVSGCNFFLTHLAEFTEGWNLPSGPGAFCFERLLIIDSISLMNMFLFRFSISLCVSFGSCVFQGIGPFCLGHQICGHRVVLNIPLLFPPPGLFSFLAAPWHMEFPGQESNMSRSGDLHHSCGNAGSLTHCSGPGVEPVSLLLQRHCQSHCATAELPFLTFSYT